MSIGLIALLDDVAAIAKVAAASLDDVAGQVAKAGAKAAGVVIDDAAVTPRYVTGFSADRELPIVAKITRGSLRNKLIFLLPVALALSAFAPWAITPLLMLGGAFLCYEGAEKVYEAIVPHHAEAHVAGIGSVALAPASAEDAKVASAIKTDFILSAEIMAITLASLPPGSFWMQAVVLALVGIAITLLVYGGVALIVKADDIGLALAKRENGTAFSRGFGRLLVRAMPGFLKGLGIVGTAAMIWVGGGIIVHGLATYGFTGIEHGLHVVSEAAARALPALGGAVAWIVTAAGSGVVGLVLGLALIPVVGYGLAPAWKTVKGLIVRPAAPGPA